MQAADILTVVALAALAAVAYLRYRDVLYPPFLQATLWAAVLALYCLEKDEFLPLSPGMYLLMINGVFLFSLGGFLATYQYRPALHRVHFVEAGRDPLLAAFFWVPILGLPLFIHRAVQLASNGPTGQLFLDLNMRLVQNRDGGFGWLAYLTTISFASVALHALLTPSSLAGRLKLPCALVVATIYSVFFTGRTFLFTVILMTAGIFMITRKLKPGRALAWCTLTMLLAFVSMPLLMKRDINPVGSFGENALMLWHSFRVYLLGALPAFDRLMTLSPAPAYGQHMLRTVFAVTDKLGFDTPMPLLSEFVKVPVLTPNVYTVYHPYFTDFSYCGAVVIQFFLGLWHGRLYKKAGQGDPLSVCLYALFLYPLFMQFFEDEYFSLLSKWIQFGLIFAIFFAMRRRSIVPHQQCEIAEPPH